MKDKKILLYAGTTEGRKLATRPDGQWADGRVYEGV